MNPQERREAGMDAVRAFARSHRPLLDRLQELEDAQRALSRWSPPPPDPNPFPRFRLFKGAKRRDNQ